MILNISLEEGKVSQKSLGEHQKSSDRLSVLMENSQQQLEAFFEQEDDHLLKIFQSYCSFGEPLNTSRLKTTKFQKIFMNAGLLLETTNSPGGRRF